MSGPVSYEIDTAAARPPAEPWRPAADPCTDFANANRLRAMYADKLLCVPGVGWHVFDSERAWRADDDAAAHLAAKLGRAILAESSDWLRFASTLAHGEGERERAESRAKALHKHAGASESARAIHAALDLARGLFALPVEQIDAKPDLLALHGGVLDLRTGEHRAHRPDDYLTRIAGCTYDGDAICPRWCAFLREVLPDSGAQRYVQKCFGYSLSAHRGEHIVMMLLGAGCNGKSVLLQTWSALLAELAIAAPPDLITAKQTAHPAELAMLRGARLVTLSEPQDGRLAVERLKSLSGGDKISARHLHREFFEFEPVCLLVVALNARLRTNDAGAALWRRIREVDFPVAIPPERRDVRLPERLRGELPGILNWALEGWRLYQAEGLDPPEVVLAATERYREQSDPLGAFIAECCIVDADAWVSGADLHKAYSRWANEAGELPLSRRVLGERIEQRGFKRTKRDGGAIRAWSGIRLSVRDELL
jgi:putative DNA primase/helicase